ncbi:MAG TPA: hypothetical protein VFL71_00970 [Actinomycetes bacterium]|nr:hypothetical protein [Actinomycetes bacterium]
MLHSPDNAADAGRMLDWGFGRGRSARTGLRLPAYVAPASVDALLVRRPLTVERHRPLAARAAPAPAPDGQGQPGQPADGAAGGGPGRDGPAVPWSVRAAAATGAGAVAALLAAAGLVVRRRRHARR